MTSNISAPFRPGDTLISDWKAAGLLKPSAVRGVLATVDKGDIYRKLGRLTKADFSQVQKDIPSTIYLSGSSLTA